MENEVRLVRTDVLKEYFCAACSTHKRYKRSVEECRNYTDSYGNGCFKMRLIDNTPSAPPETLRPTGRWEQYADFWRKCSICGGTWHEQWIMSKQLNYCPNCGARMEG